AARAARPDLDDGDPVLGNVAEIWSEVLRIGRPALLDDFFDLGGDSLRLPQVQKMIKDRLGVEIGPLDLFGAPTLGELAEVVRSRLDGSPR
ncbi:phosphopantetheine-binding protein, partial [Streptosporangium algeriense]